jgi:hypothetical protein
MHRTTPLVLNMTPDNDNDPLTFVRLAALTANVTRFLLLKGNEQADHKSDKDNGSADQGDECKADRSKAHIR